MKKILFSVFCTSFLLLPFGSAVLAASVGDACTNLGESVLSSDGTETVICLKQKSTDATCSSSSACVYKSMESPRGLVRISFEMVGAGGGGGGSDTSGLGGSGGRGALLQFDTYLPVGTVLTVSPGGAGYGGISSSSGVQGGGGDVGSALFANGGRGGEGEGYRESSWVGASGDGGGGGAASSVSGGGLFAVAGGGGGGGGGSYGLAGSAGSSSTGGMTGPQGGVGIIGCYGGDGGGGGGGGGGYPGGAGGTPGCDYDVGNYAAQGGRQGQSYLNASYSILGFSHTSNASGFGLGGGTQSNGSCGRITIWDSSGNASVFDCGGISMPVWVVK